MIHSKEILHRDLKSANIFKSVPVFVPEPLVIEKNQRPFPAP